MLPGGGGANRSAAPIKRHAWNPPEQLRDQDNQATTDEYRILLGASGLAWGWDYNVGAYYVSSEVTDTYLGGYLLESKPSPPTRRRPRQWFWHCAHRR